MTAAAVQLSFFETSRVVVEFHPKRPPPGATGPCDYGAFAATLVTLPDETGRGRTENVALRALADHLRVLAPEQPAGDSVTAATQALTAARQLSDVELLAWLSEHSDDPVLPQKRGTCGR